MRRGLRAFGQLVLAVILLGSAGGVFLWLAQQDDGAANVVAWLHTPTTSTLRVLGSPANAPSPTVSPKRLTTTATPDEDQGVTPTISPTATEPDPLSTPTASPTIAQTAAPTVVPATSGPTAAPPAPTRSAAASGPTRIGVRANL
ncbi:MAG: hypothetical protein KKB13_27460, partial [Chloroflexi bacterium]|nr:hypothetical protein [Chloroflexota bacterium]